MALPFSSATQAWVQYLASLDVNSLGGMDFLQAWIQKESGGNPCSWTKYHEAGIWQFMPANLMTDTGNDFTLANTTMAEQHPIPPCVAGAQSGATVADLTPDQINAQVQAGATYINYAVGVVQTALSNAGSTIDQTNPDFWRFVKLVHGAPAWVKYQIQAVTNELGAPLSSWDDFETVAKSHGCWGSAHCSDTLANARAVGAYGTSDPNAAPPDPSIADQIVVLAGPDQPLTVGEIVFVGLAALTGVVGAFYAARWLHVGEAR